jgi:hypothetical protein
VVRIHDEAPDPATARTQPSVAHRALNDHFGATDLPDSAAADGLRLVHGILPAPRESADATGQPPSPPGAHATPHTPDAATVLSALTLLRELRDELTDWEPRLIDDARALGVSWTQLAPALGVASRQAAERRYLRLRLRPAGPQENHSTGDQRVRNERDRRAEERAVIDWARQHAATLRQIAARVADLSALGDLDDPARHSVDRVQRTLNDNDTAALLAPLSDASHALGDTHPDLAQAINGLLDQTDALRQDTRQRRTDQRT